MSITETIKNRRSVRNYTGEALKAEHANPIVAFISALRTPFPGKYRIELIRTNASAEPVRLGTYSVISGASDFLALMYEPDDNLAEENAAYCFEQVVLFCTSLGLGTCWLGGTFNRSNFAAQVDLQATEILRIVSPVGYIKNEKRLVETLIGADRHHKSRKSFSTHFYDGSFDKPLTEENAGIYREPLEMLRLAPSANNRQAWRIVLDDDNVHFYCHRASLFDFSRTDLGIALCHFDLTCRESGIQGSFEVLEKRRETTSGDKNRYAVTWIKSLSPLHGEKSVIS